MIYEDDLLTLWSTDMVSSFVENIFLLRCSFDNNITSEHESRRPEKVSLSYQYRINDYMRQTQDRVPWNMSFSGHPPFINGKHFRIILGLIGIKPQKIAFTSTVHFFVLFPLASEYEFDNSKLAFVDYFDFLWFGFLRKSVRTRIWRKWLGVSVVQVSWAYWMWRFK